MIGRVLTSALAALLASAPLGATAADQSRPIRTLTYAVDISLLDEVETTVPAAAGMARMPTGGGRQRAAGSAGSSGPRSSGVSLSTKGTILVDILQATDDAGLVVEISENAPKRMRPKVRVGVAVDGSLLVDPASSENLSVEETAVVRWLGRGFFGDHPTEVGTAWTIDQSAPGYTDVQRYRVTARDAARVTLAYASQESTTVAGGYAGSREGTIVYDTALIVPLKATFDGVGHRQIGAGYNTTRTSVQLTLTADSFGASPQR